MRFENLTWHPKMGVLKYLNSLSSDWLKKWENNPCWMILTSNFASLHSNPTKSLKIQDSCPYVPWKLLIRHFRRLNPQINALQDQIGITKNKLREPYGVKNTINEYLPTARWRLSKMWIISPHRLNICPLFWIDIIFASENIRAWGKPSHSINRETCGWK